MPALEAGSSTFNCKQSGDSTSSSTSSSTDFKNEVFYARAKGDSKTNKVVELEIIVEENNNNSNTARDELENTGLFKQKSFSIAVLG